MVPHTFPPPQLESRHGTFLGSIWDVLLLPQAQFQPPLTAPPSVHCLCLCPASTIRAGVCGHCQAACSHTKLALPEGSLPAREIPVTLGKHQEGSWSGTSLQAVPGVPGGATPRVPDFCSTAHGIATASALPTPSCSICRRYFLPS